VPDRDPDDEPERPYLVLAAPPKPVSEMTVEEKRLCSPCGIESTPSTS
jgi:hypothetical protein